MPQGQGFVIVNDVLLLTSATVKQIQAFGQNKSKAGPSNDRQMIDVIDTPSHGIKSRLGLSPITGPGMSGPSVSPHEEVVKHFMSSTGMNRSFSQQCLEENAFDFNTAFNVFQKLKTENLIPSEAFAP